jgi:predicted site-specific integrase-resolvase
MTAHARTRMQQRGIRAAALEALLDYGKVEHVDRGCEIVYFDKAARVRFAKQKPDLARDVDRLTRTYAILGSDGAVVTVGSRYRRIRRH